MFVAVLSFGAGVAVMDTAYDARERPVCRQAMAVAERAVEQSERFGRALAHVLNGGSIKTNEVVASCRVKPISKES